MYVKHFLCFNSILVEIFNMTMENDKSLVLFFKLQNKHVSEGNE